MENSLVQPQAHRIFRIFLFNMTSSQSKSSHSAKQKKDKQKQSHSKCQSSHRYNIAEGSFLFVVNELKVNPQMCPMYPPTWSQGPPRDWTGFEGETPGTVFRYQDGRIQEALDFCWYRTDGQMGNPGYISYIASDDPYYPPISIPSILKASMFDCWRFCPRMFSYGDPTENNSESDADNWHFLHFETMQCYPTASYISHAGSRHTIGSDKSWGIIPASYNNTFSNAPLSGGLTGDISLILGLMALTRRIGQADDAFRRCWNGPGQPWRGNSIIDLPPEATPRGVLVHVAADPGNLTGSNEEFIKGLSQRIILPPSPL